MTPSNPKSSAKRDTSSICSGSIHVSICQNFMAVPSALVLAAVEEAVEGIRIRSPEGGAIVLKKALAARHPALHRIARPDGAEPAPERRPARERIPGLGRLREPGIDGGCGADPGPGGAVGDRVLGPAEEGRLRQARLKHPKDPPYLAGVAAHAVVVAGRRIAGEVHQLTEHRADRGELHD